MAEASTAPADRGLDPRGRLHIPVGIANTVDTLKTFVEAEGGFSPGLGTFGVSFWLWDADTARLAAPTQEGAACEHGLAPGGLLVPWAEWQVDGLQVRTEVCQVTRSTRGGRVYLVGARAAVTNLGDRPRRARLFAALRALGPAGGAVERLEVAPGGDALVADGHPALVADRMPSAAGVVGADTVGRSASEGEVPAGIEAAADDGGCSGALAFDLELAPGDSEAFGFVCPVLAGRRAVGHRWDGVSEWAQLDLAELNPHEGGELQPDPGLAYLRQVRVDGLFRDALRYWRDLAGRVSLILPDRRWAEAFSAIAAHVALAMNEGAPDVSVVNFNVFNRDGVYVTSILQKAGQIPLAEAAIDYFLSHPYNGRVHPEADNPGQVLWILGEHWRFTQDREWLSRVYPSAVRLAEMVGYYRTTPGPHWVSPNSLGFGDALPPGERVELVPGACDGHHPEYTEAFDLAGLRSAALLATAMDDLPTAQRCASLIEKLAADYDGRYGDHLGREYGSYCVLWPCRLYALGHGRAYERFRNLGSQAPAGWRYFPLATAHQGLLAGSREAASETLRLHLEHEQMRGWYAFDEGGDSGPGLWPRLRTTWNPSVAMPHGWAVAELHLLLRDSLLFEDSDRLVLLSGVPEAWFGDSSGIRFDRMPTHFGALSLRYRPEPGGAVIDLGGACEPPAGYVLRLPAGLGADAVLPGQPGIVLQPDESGALALPAGTRRVRLRYR